MKVPMLNLKSQYQSIKEEINSAVLDVLASQQCVLGKKGEALEEQIASYTDARFALGVSSGTDALLLALMALGIGPGDEVITSPYSFFATAGSISRSGATPVFADIQEGAYNIDPDGVARKISSKTKAILPVHLFGEPADMDALIFLAKKHSLKIIEDGAQAIGARYKGRLVCGLGDVGTLSFYPTKNLGGIGDGGMVITNDEHLYRMMKKLRNHGMEPKYYHEYIGGNFRLDEIQAAVLLVKFKYLDEWTNKRREAASYYNTRFQGTAIKTPNLHPENYSVCNQYVIEVAQRDALIKHLSEKEIGTDIYYPIPLHLQGCYRFLGYCKGDFPVAERAAENSLALPVCPEMTIDMLKYVANSILDFV